MVAQPVAVGVSRAGGVEGLAQAVGERRVVGHGHRPAIGACCYRRQAHRQQPVGIVGDEQAQIVRDLLAAAGDDGRGRTALLGQQLDGARPPFVLARCRQGHRTVGAGEGDLAAGGVKIVHRQALRIGRHGEGHLGGTGLVGDPHRRDVVRDLQAVGPGVAPVARAQRCCEQVAVIAGETGHLEAKDVAPADMLALRRQHAGQRLPGIVEAGILAEPGLRQLLAAGDRRAGDVDGSLLRGPSGARHRRRAGGALAAEERIAHLAVPAGPVLRVERAAGIGIEHAQIEPVGRGVGDAEIDNLAVVLVALGRSAAGP